jgi:uncharacterized membrane protein YhfC
MCVSVALVIQHAERMRRFVLLSVAYLIFIRYEINGTVFEKRKYIEHKICVLIFCTVLFEISPILGRKLRFAIINVH